MIPPRNRYSSRRLRRDLGDSPPLHRAASEPLDKPRRRAPEASHRRIADLHSPPPDGPVRLTPLPPSPLEEPSLCAARERRGGREVQGGRGAAWPPPFLLDQLPPPQARRWPVLLRAAAGGVGGGWGSTENTPIPERSLRAPLGGRFTKPQDSGREGARSLAGGPPGTRRHG